jgi:hypothetical protein
MIEINNKTPAVNERFGASGAVPRPKVSADFQVLCLVLSAVNPSPRKAATTLAVMRGRQCNGKTK